MAGNGDVEEEDPPTCSLGKTGIDSKGFLLDDDEREEREERDDREEPGEDPEEPGGDDELNAAPDPPKTRCSPRVSSLSCSDPPESTDICISCDPSLSSGTSDNSKGV